MTARIANSPIARHRPAAAEEIARLLTLGPEAQGEVDESLLRSNLALSPAERLQAANETARQIEILQLAMKAATHA